MIGFDVNGRAAVAAQQTRGGVANQFRRGQAARQGGMWRVVTREGLGNALGHRIARLGQYRVCQSQRQNHDRGQ